MGMRMNKPLHFGLRSMQNKLFLPTSMFQFDSPALKTPFRLAGSPLKPLRSTLQIPSYLVGPTNESVSPRRPKRPLTTEENAIFGTSPSQLGGSQPSPFSWGLGGREGRGNPSPHDTYCLVLGFPFHPLKVIHF